MEQLMDIIKRRVSTRAYQNKPLDKDTVKVLLDAARYAPSARNLQQLEYKVITNESLMQRLSNSIAETLKKEMANMPPRPGAPPLPIRPHFFYRAPLLILITGPKDNHWIDADAALAVQNVMLFATSINLGSCFIGMARLIDRDNAMRQELHIAAEHKIAAAVICGYPDEKPAAKEKNMKAEYFE